MGPGYDGMDEDYLLDTPDQPDQLADDRLEAQVGLLEAELRRVVSREPTLSQFLHIEPPAGFFTASNFREYIKAFFQRDQLLATVIHRPTFHPDRVDLTLLLAIAVAGSAYLLYRRRRVDSATFVFALREIAERYIFNRVEQLLGSAASSPDAQKTVEVCQAAYILETLQSCVKDPRTRQRLITKCHPMFVDVLRDLGMIGSRHEAFPSGTDWSSFVHRESCIRLAHWVFINDAWFTLFTNHPPAMTFLDMTGDLPCEDALWAAESPKTFQDLMARQDWGGERVLCLRSVMSGLLGEEWKDETVARFQQMHIKHLLVAILGESAGAIA